MKKTKKSKFFGLLNKAISPSGKASAGKSGHQKSASYSGKRTRQRKIEDVEEK